MAARKIESKILVSKSRMSVSESVKFYNFVDVKKLLKLIMGFYFFHKSSSFLLIR